MQVNQELNRKIAGANAPAISMYSEIIQGLYKTNNGL